MLESLFNTVAGLKACNFIKKDSTARIFLRNLWNFWKRLFFTEHLLWLILSISFPIEGFHRRYYRIDLIPKQKYSFSFFLSYIFSFSNASNKFELNQVYLTIVARLPNSSDTSAPRLLHIRFCSLFNNWDSFDWDSFVSFELWDSFDWGRKCKVLTRS